MESALQKAEPRCVGSLWEFTMNCDGSMILLREREDKMYQILLR